jgi:hypothetical protein
MYEAVRRGLRGTDRHRDAEMGNHVMPEKENLYPVERLNFNKRMLVLGIEQIIIESRECRW